MKFTFTLVIAFAVTLSSLAQNISGIVLSETSRPIEGTYVFNETSGSYSFTSEIGKFVIPKTNTGDILRIGSIGYETQYVNIEKQSDKKTLTVKLKEKSVELSEVVVQPKLDALNIFSKIDVKNNPINNAQEVLRYVPGLFIGQHAGGGKAEQIFLRGFDIDHGTDLSISVDGMPVNMVSHAHGQGYSDMHFLIPETIEQIDFNKGSYDASKGNFATAGSVNLRIKDQLDGIIAKVEYGQFNRFRTVALVDLLGKKKTNQQAYVGAEWMSTNGFFEASQDFKRLNLIGKFTNYFPNNDKITFTASHFTSNWLASGQIPQRAIDSGLIGRFGAIDATEGGNTSRSNFQATYFKTIGENASINTNVYYTLYDFELYSNFTFFLEDPVNGDQIKQRENRGMLGFTSEFNQVFNIIDNKSVDFRSGIGLRNDRVRDNELSRTLNRTKTLERIQFGNINETNAFAYTSAEVTLGKWLIAPALRFDNFTFDYTDFLEEGAIGSKSTNQSIVSPKLNFIYSPSARVQYFLKSGIGFHANDTRVAVVEGNATLPKSYGADLGTIWKPTNKLLINSSLWYLFLEQEFVYVGDAGIVEPSGRTQRMGADLGIRYQLTQKLFFDTDFTYTYARSIDDPKGENYIPLAPAITWTSGLSFADVKGFSGGIKSRMLGNRPANEDYSITAEGYFVTDLNVNYSVKCFTFGVAIDNAFNTKWNETQFATESRLRNELNPVEEIHFTPGTPFALRGIVSIKF
ncbi:MAG: outer membrane receptor protein involved in Fe transport [Spirosomataceae bacterium]|jgi:outer membrane receptor protein involved in Fe transport